MESINFKEEWSDEGAICPYCGYLHDPNDGDFELYDDCLDEWTCQCCGKKFRLSVHVRHSWETSTMEDK